MSFSIKLKNLIRKKINISSWDPNSLMEKVRWNLSKYHTVTNCSYSIIEF